MSHRDSCPSPWEARREGERAFERGSGSYSNPYDRWHGNGACREAEREWHDGHRYAERQAEERAQEERARHQAQQRRYEAEQEEAAFYASMEEQRYQEEAEAEYFATLEAEMIDEFCDSMHRITRWEDDGGPALEPQQ